MDANLMSCPTCSHTVSNSAGACTYCGALMDVQQTPTDEEDVTAKVPELKSPPPLSRNEISWADTLPTDADIEAAVEEKLDVQELQDEITPVVDDTLKIAQIEAEGESVIDDILLPPDLEVVDLAGDEPGGLETLEENIIELVETAAVQQESEKPSTPVVALPSDESVEKAQAHLEEAAQPMNEAEVAGEAEAGLRPESPGETIFLELTDEVQLEAGEPLQESQKTAELESPAKAEARKVKKQKAALAKALAVKKQKAALAKTRAQKKQKMIMAKDAALKRKKAAQAKALQLKKQSAAAKNTNEAGHTRGVQSLDANTKMQDLLEKYKGQAIGINYDNSADIREAQLVDANCEYFRVFAEQNNLYYTYPFKSILTVIEGQDGVAVGDSKEKVKFSVVIKVYPLVLF
ncbi:MAG: hypothetical protein GY850_13325 [bacterium]|nr:hypothetical protein [bacterium]